MIFAVYIMLLVLSLTFIFLGYKLEGNADIFKIVGYGFLFIIGVMLLPGTPGSLEYTTGTIITETVDGYVTADQTAVYEDFMIGFFLSTAAVFGFINCYATRKSSGGFGTND